ncbi:cytochrome P450 [Streptomyces sp. NPDC002659]|uniref:cytochrome P450 n=1 Tax=Streptomyces sp. NPDC002659 TaxID=3364656 RepID=UPI0036938040
MGNGMVAAERSLSLYSLISRKNTPDPHNFYDRLAREAPVHWDPYTRCWLVSGRAEALQVLSDDVFSSGRLLHSDALHAHTSLADLSTVHKEIGKQLLFVDGDAHAKLRKIIQGVLTPRRLQPMKARISALADDLTDFSDGGPFDVVERIAQPLPFRVAAEFLGLPEDDFDTLKAWSDSYTDIVTGFEPTIGSAVASQMLSYLEYAVDLVRARRRRPSGDGLSLIISAADGVSGLDDHSVASNLIMLLAAGHQTAPGFLAGSVLEMVGPSSGFGPVGRVGAAPDVEDLLARVSPSRFVGRTAVRSTSVGGCVIEEGQSVLVLLAAVNWSDLRRQRRAVPVGQDRAPAHIAFGYGRHRCPGAYLAKLEGEIVLSAVERRFPDMRLAEEEISWDGNVNLPCPVRLNITNG